MTASTLPPGTAPIKPEYILKPSEAQAIAPTDTDTRTEEITDQKDNENTSSGPPKKKQRRGRGQNKNRKAGNSRDEFDICRRFASGDPCQEPCRFSHDLASYLAVKPADIGDRCIHFSVFGKCPYGHRCRYAKMHTNPEDGSLMVNEERQATAPKAHVNFVRSAFLKDLRTKKLSFSRSKKVLSLIEEEKQRQQEERASQVVSKVSGLEDKAKEGHTDGDGPIESKKEESGKEPKIESKKSEGDNPHNEASVKEASNESTYQEAPLRQCEKKEIDIRGKTYLAPLTTVGNLPFRRVCKGFGVDITCGEMAVATNLLQGLKSEWALIKRHPSEDIFGVQVCGNKPDPLVQCAELLSHEDYQIDFIDLNVGCPIDTVFNRGAGSALMDVPNKLGRILRGMDAVTSIPITAKIRMGVMDARPTAHHLIPRISSWGLSNVTLHGRSRQQRYTKSADWDYVQSCSKSRRGVLANEGDRTIPMSLFGNGDVLSWEDYYSQVNQDNGVDGVMIGRGALIKPWIFQEIQERRHWDISSGERLDILRQFCDFGLEHWGSDTQGVNLTRRFLCEWQSFLHRYIPIGLLEVMPPKINDRPPAFRGRNDLETLMASPNASDWVKISEMLLGPSPADFSFVPKHKANSYTVEG
ncbi:hypothetical protein BJ684DRAFT_14936 [Piptocephalis cylindrospora]|uniref:tRNA-dihydrouridine(47) synthase [NAD(P)(+)] n=1 Tax=Piptocephalis cylindrospora TaxID=1907219 RepID=A0A4P9Y9Q1_9FUNG|nr:hypothetical protein BJ684DRAFT_14936 [Piptocephalis cylindrospora]|eukprot:RKP14760.1 hypothetical protein BJ684DRAFT_14936 [Piptocephalis cylindrospora]